MRRVQPTLLASAEVLVRLARYAAIALVIGGCAKYPSSSTGATSKRVSFTMTISGALNPNYVYIVALNPSTQLNPTTTGPIPVVAAPWGNGFVAGGCTYFVEWIPAQSPDYGIFKFTGFDA